MTKTPEEIIAELLAPRLGPVPARLVLESKAGTREPPEALQAMRAAAWEAMRGRLASGEPLVAVDLRRETEELAARRGADISQGPVFDPETQWWGYPIYPVQENGVRYVPRPFDPERYRK